MSIAVLEALIARNHYQHGPSSGSESLLQYWIIIPVIIIFGIVVILYAYRSWFPKLHTIQPTDHLKNQVRQHTDSNVNDRSEHDNQNFLEEKSQEIEEDSSSIDVVLRLLETDERRVIEALLEAGGSLLQKDISWKTGFSRVKTHRILVRLLRRDVVTSEKYYNTNRITLSDWIQQTT
jgi:uncharacterized membrane protein